MLSQKPFAKTISCYLSLALAGAVLVFSGCVSKVFTYVTTVSGGEEIRFTLSQGGPQHAKSDGFEVLNAGLVPDFTAKTIQYSFQFSDSAGGKLLQSVRVEDVTEAAPILVFEDLQPKVVKGVWAGKSAVLSPDDPSLNWIAFVSDSMRVYRFTLTLSDGRKVILHQLVMTPSWVKATIRTMFGQKY